MHFSTALLFSFSLALVRGVVANSASQTSPLGLTTKHGKTTKRDVSSPLDKRQSCQGTCQSCFGSSYRECPDDETYCYDTDLGSASEQCSGSTPTGSPFPEPTGTDTCSIPGASCVVCFGPGYIYCPSGSYYDCYDPSEYSQSEGCNDPSGGGSGAGGSSAPPSPSSTGTTQSQCEENFGSGSVPCGSRACYNPGEGEVCCGDGTHCPADTRCVPAGDDYECEETDSTSSEDSDTTTRTSTRTSTRTISSATGTGLIPGGLGDTSTSSSSRTSRTTSLTSSSTAMSTTSAIGSDSGTSDGIVSAPPSLGMLAVAVVALMGGVLSVVGFL